MGKRYVGSYFVTYHQLQDCGISHTIYHVFNSCASTLSTGYFLGGSLLFFMTSNAFDKK